MRAVQTTGACVSSAARVVAHRFRVTKEDLITSADAPAGDIDTHKELEGAIRDTHTHTHTRTHTQNTHRHTHARTGLQGT